MYNDLILQYNDLIFQDNDDLVLDDDLDVSDKSKLSKEDIKEQERLIDNTKSQEYIDDYYGNIFDLDNIIVDTENLYLDKNLAFPCLTFFDYINKHNTSKSKINIHFITKMEKNCIVIQEDIKGALLSSVFKGEYISKRTGVKYNAQFLGLDDFIKNRVNIYFHKLGDGKNKDKDDIYLLYLLDTLDKVHFYSKDFKMFKDHVVNMKFKYTIPVNVTIYKFNHILNTNILIKSQKITLKHIELKSDFIDKYNNNRIIMR